VLREWDGDRGPEEWIRPLVAFSPDGKYLLAGRGDGPCTLWETATGERRAEMRLSKFPHRAQAVSADVAMFAVVTVAGDVRVWKVATGQLLREWSVPGKPKAVALSPDGKTLATGEETGVIRLWETRTHVERGRLEGVHSAGVSALAFAPNGCTLASGDKNAGIVLWDLSGKARPRSWKVEPPEKPSEPSGVSVLRFTPDGKTLGSAGAGGLGILDLWEVASGKRVCRIRDSHPLEFAFSPDSKTVATLGSWYVHLWNVSSGRMVPGQGHKGIVDQLAFSPDDQSVTSVAGVETVVWDAATGKERRTLEPGNSPRTLSGNGLVVAEGNATGGTDIRDTVTGKRLWALPTGAQAAHCLSHDGKTLAVMSPDRVIVWDLASGKRVGIPATVFSGRHLAFSRNGKLLAIAEEHPYTKGLRRTFSVSLWELGTGKWLRTFPVDSSSLFQMAFSPNGASFAILTLDDLYVYEVPTGEKRLQKAGQYHSLAFSADSRRLAVNTSGGLYLWDALSGRTIRCFKDQPEEPYALTFSHDGKRLAVGCADTSILVWDLTQVSAPKPEEARLSAGVLERLWQDLGGSAETACKAMHTFTQAPNDATAFLTKRLAAPSPEDMPRLVADLDSNDFKVREQAVKGLIRMSYLAAPALQRYREDPKLPADMRRRLAGILRLRELSKDALVWGRITELLEYLCTPGARTLLERLAEGTGPIADQARAALTRLRPTASR
jgi:WD40 repeat protein